MKTIRTYRVSLHGHSPASDGVSSIREIVEAAGRAKLDYLGISDHETTAGIEGFYREVARYNQIHGTSLAAVAGVEIHFADSGDVVIVKPGNLNRAFLSWAQRIITKRKTYPTVKAIGEAVRRWGAFVIIPHPAAPFAGSVSFEKLEDIVRKLDPKLRQSVGLEVRNFATKLFGPHTWVREIHADSVARRLGLVRIASADFHQSWMVEKDYTLVKASNTKRAPLMLALKARQTILPTRARLTLTIWFRLLVTLARANFGYRKRRLAAKFNNFARENTLPTSTHAALGYE